MALTAHMVTIDRVNPAALAQFWTEAAGHSVGADWGEHVMLVPSTGALRIGPQLCVGQAPDRPVSAGSPAGSAE